MMRQCCREHFRRPVDVHRRAFFLKRELGFIMHEVN